MLHPATAGKLAVAGAVNWGTGEDEVLLGDRIRSRAFDAALSGHLRLSGYTWSGRPWVWMPFLRRCHLGDNPGRPRLLTMG